MNISATASQRRASAQPAPLARLQLLELPQPRNAVFEQVLSGLHEQPRRIEPRYFYDAVGSQLFEQITHCPEYYPTRTEHAILRDHAAEIAAVVGPDCVLIEPGSGNCEKVERLLEALEPSLYVPLDICANTLRNACERLLDSHPWLQCTAIAGEYGELSRLPELLPEQRRVVFYPGSSLGNFEPAAAIRFLRELRALVGLEGGILLGVDNNQNEALLNRAYDDAAGITAAFNRNVLRHLNRLIDADFVPEAFDHVAFFNAAHGRIEMHLRSRYVQTVRLGDSHIKLAAGEMIHTENSYKYSQPAMLALAAEAGLRCRMHWHDSDCLFGLYYLVADAGMMIDEYAEKAVDQI